MRLGDYTFAGRPRPITKARRSDRAMRELRAALERVEPRIARQVIAAVDRLRGRLTLDKLQSIVESAGGAGVLQALQPEIERLAADLAGATAEEGVKGHALDAYRAGVEAARGALPAALEMEARFDLTNPRALDWLRRYDFGLIREVTQETREAVRGAVLDAFERGGHPRQQARRIRDALGLTSKQGRAIRNFRAQLEQRTNSPDGRPMQAAGNRRLNAAERAAARRQLRQGGMSQAQIDALADRYWTRLRNLRAETIARTETIRASSQGQTDLWRQAMDDGLLDATTTRFRWVVTRDERTCPICRPIPGMNEGGVRMGQPFQTPVGPIAMPPAHPSCRCTRVIASF